MAGYFFVRIHNRFGSHAWRTCKELPMVANFIGNFVQSCEIDKACDNVRDHGGGSQATLNRYLDLRDILLSRPRERLSDTSPARYPS